MEDRPHGDRTAGWEWVWELTPQGPDWTLVRHTYDWTAVDKKLREKLPFPVLSEKQLADTLGNLAAAVAG